MSIIIKGEDPKTLDDTTLDTGSNDKGENVANQKGSNSGDTLITIDDDTIDKEVEDVCLRFGTSVRTMRRAKEMTQHDLADKSGLNRTYMVRVESGDRNITLKTAHKIAKALDTDVISLLQGVEIVLKTG